MAVMLRLSRHGAKARPFYRLVAADKVRWRDGKYIELLGTVDPLTNPPTNKINEARVRYWISVGAQYSGKVRDMVRKVIPGIIEAREEHSLKTLQAARKKRKDRIKASGKKSAPVEKKAKSAKK